MKKFILLMYDGKWDLSAMRSLFCKNSRSILDKSDPDEIDRSIKATQGIRKSLSPAGNSGRRNYRCDSAKRLRLLSKATMPMVIASLFAFRVRPT